MESRSSRNEKLMGRLVLCLLMSFLVTSFSAVCSEGDEPSSQEPLLGLLPSEADLKGWKLDGEPQTAEGMALFELINGGAEEYVKEGFRRAVMATYINGEGKRINLEVYEMLSPESARRIHRKKAGDKGTKVPVGEEAAMEDYYLNFQKGSFQVTLSGYDTQKMTLEWLLQIGRLVAERISAPARTQ
jgi:hypothetical protein